MRLHLCVVGRMGPGPEAELVARYLQRLSWPVKVTEIAEGKPLIWPAPLTPCRTVVLDEKGRTLDSRTLATQLGEWRDQGVRETRWLIGGADGHAPAVRQSADLLLALGSMTWPHLLVRAMVAEQLYRAVSILQNHPYHRAG